MIKNRKIAAFSLVELLVVIAVIAILAGLSVPAMKGLVGVSGVRGATNSLTSAFDQARFAAIENAVPAYLGFPGENFTSPNNPTVKFSSFIIFRERSPSEPDSDPLYKALSRWIILPTGTMFDLSNASLDSSIAEAAAPLLPQLDGQDVSVEVIKFDKFGKVVSGEPDMKILIGNGIVGSSGSPVFPSNSEVESYIVQRLTGRIFPEAIVQQQ
jgi:prepilin-type N-terminal cleavage/methylation domain-containing protein